MSGLLIGRAAQISFGSVLTGRNILAFGQVPAGTYHLGHLDYSNNPPRNHRLKNSIQVQTTPFTQGQFHAVRNALGNQNHLVMALRGGHHPAVVVARGTREEIGKFSNQDIVGVIEGD